MVSQAYIPKAKDANITSIGNFSSDMVHDGLAPYRPGTSNSSKSLLTYILVPLASLIAFAIVAVTVSKAHISHDMSFKVCKVSKE